MQTFISLHEEWIYTLALKIGVMNGVIWIVIQIIYQYLFVSRLSVYPNYYHYPFLQISQSLLSSFVLRIPMIVHILQTLSKFMLSSRIDYLITDIAFGIFAKRINFPFAFCWLYAFKCWTELYLYNLFCFALYFAS